MRRLVKRMGQVSSACAAAFTGCRCCDRKKANCASRSSTPRRRAASAPMDGGESPPAPRNLGSRGEQAVVVDFWFWCGEPVDPALALALVYAAAYLAVDRRAGALAGLLFVAAWAASAALAARLGFAASWRFVLVTQLFCWTWQLLGHGLFEKKGPTVSDLPQVFLMEPFLIFLQILNKLFGYEPYPGFYKNVDKKMDADLRESRELKQRKTS